MVDCPALPSAIKLTTPPFPSLYKTPMVANAKLQKALDDAMAFAATVHPSLTDMGVALIALENPGAHAMAHQKGDIVYFGASMMKVAALYGLYELRTTLRKIAVELGCHTGPTELLKQAARHLDPQILDYTKTKLPAFTGIARAHALPQYSKAFKAVAKPDKTFTVDFSDAFIPRPFDSHGEPGGHIDKMIAKSHNISAGTCLHACGYGYLSGALAEGGHFDPKTGRKGVGIFLAGDYWPKDSPGKYPAYRVDSAEGGTSQGSTALHLARLLTLLADKQLFGGDAEANAGMLDALTKAVTYGHVFLNRGDGDPGDDPLRFTVRQTKLGHAPISGVEHYSECSLLEHDSGKRFVIAWLNLRWGSQPYDELDAFSHAIRDAMEAYLAP